MSKLNPTACIYLSVLVEGQTLKCSKTPAAELSLEVSTSAEGIWLKLKLKSMV